MTAALLGRDLTAAARELIRHGAERVFTVDDPRLEGFTDEGYGEVLTQIIGAVKPEILLAGATPIGRSFIPKVATQVGTGTNGRLHRTGDRSGKTPVAPDPSGLRREYHGHDHLPAAAAPDGYGPAQGHEKRGCRMETRSGEIIPFELDWSRMPGRTRLLEIVEELTEKVRLAEADVIVTGGRGLQDGKHFHLIRELADLLGAAVGASRGAVDSGWISYAHQVGQTGKTVAPKLYVAIGVSGRRPAPGGHAIGGDHRGRQQPTPRPLSLRWPPMV